MADLYYSPVFYGIHEVTVSGDSGDFALRIYYPSEDGAVWHAPILPGKYPLVVFAHGDRLFEPSLCPPDTTTDYQRWVGVLHLLARCGFVVAAPALHDVLGSDSEPAAVRIEDTIRWMRTQWSELEHITYPGGFLAPIMMGAGGGSEESDGESSSEQFRTGGNLGPTERYPQPEIDLPPLAPSPIDFGRHVPPYLWHGIPTRLGLVGHSWGARSCARVAVRGNFYVHALASIAGSWDENAAINAVLSANKPNFMICGSDDFLNFSYLNGLWSGLATPKHQAAVQGLGHWDWFGNPGFIGPCDPDASRPTCPAGWQIAAEMLLAFMTKYLRNHWWRPPYLLGSPGGRPPLLQWFDDPMRCALKIRWDDPSSSTSLGNPGEVTLGTWTETSPW